MARFRVGTRLLLALSKICNTQVRDGDGSSRLDYASTTALSAFAGDILRASSSPITPADLTLPKKGAMGSLGWSSDLLVDSTAVFVVNVRVSVFVGTHSGRGEGKSRLAASVLYVVSTLRVAPAALHGVHYLLWNQLELVSSTHMRITFQRYHLFRIHIFNISN